MDIRYAIALRLALGCIAAGGAGCAAPIRADCAGRSAPTPDYGQFHHLPRTRLGSLPFPGPFTLFARADPGSLGRHSYSGTMPDPERQEIDRGIIYTCRAGFIDICHTRKSADTVAYLYPRVAYALRNDWECVRFRGQEPSVYHVRIEYPDFWWSLRPAERLALSEELAIRMSQRLAKTVMTWHELLTWHGYKSTVILSERRSAFTHEETVSHALGVLIGGQALRAGGDYDEAVTEALDRALIELGAVGNDELDEAIRAVEGRWWADGAAIKRNIDVGLGGEPIVPWLVPDLPFCPDAEPVHLRIPTLDGVLGHDLSGFYTVSIEPNVLEAGAIRGALEDDPKRIEPRRHFPMLIARIRDEIGPENTIPGDDRRDGTDAGAVATAGQEAFD